MEIRNEELNNSKRGRSKSSSAREKDEDEGSSDEKDESLSSGLPATALPPSDEILEKNLFDAIFWRKQSLASNDMVCLVFIMVRLCHLSKMPTGYRISFNRCSIVASRRS